MSALTLRRPIHAFLIQHSFNSFIHSFIIPSISSNKASTVHNVEQNKLELGLTRLKHIMLSDDLTCVQKMKAKIY